LNERGRRPAERVGSRPAARQRPGLDPSEERDLILRSRGGDTEAFGRLVRVHQDAIYGLIVRMMRDPGLAEELTQDSFLKAYRALDSFRGASRFSTWLYRIAVNACHDHRGSQAAQTRSRETTIDLPELTVVSTAAGPDEAAEFREMAEHFEAGLAALEPAHREAFLLRHQEGLEYEEIAEVLGISAGNAKVRVHRAREAILAGLRARGYSV
jgi:RNA polymerase sigma-70 factor (ECF subfamily)